MFSLGRPNHVAFRLQATLLIVENPLCFRFLARAGFFLGMTGCVLHRFQQKKRGHVLILRLQLEPEILECCRVPATFFVGHALCWFVVCTVLRCPAIVELLQLCCAELLSATSGRTGLLNLVITALPVWGQNAWNFNIVSSLWVLDRGYWFLSGLGVSDRNW